MVPLVHMGLHEASSSPADCREVVLSDCGLHCPDKQISCRCTRWQQLRTVSLMPLPWPLQELMLVASEGKYALIQQSHRVIMMQG